MKSTSTDNKKNYDCARYEWKEYKKKPDLYGPFWIIVTLVVVLTISGNLARWLSISDKYKFSYNF